MYVFTYGRCSRIIANVSKLRPAYTLGVNRERYNDLCYLWHVYVLETKVLGLCYRARVIRATTKCVNVKLHGFNGSYMREHLLIN